jgi:GNAT superfamily N-acetyltransferase
MFRTPEEYDVELTLEGEGSFRIRSVRADDKERLADGFRRLSSESVYARFLAHKEGLSDEELTYFTEVDFVDHVALVATVGEGADEAIVGVGRYVVVGGEPDSRCAEIALTVVDEYQGRGIGAALLEHLAQIATHAGVVEFEAFTRGGDERVAQLFAKSGYEFRSEPEFALRRLTLSLPGGGK